MDPQTTLDLITAGGWILLVTVLVLSIFYGKDPDSDGR